MSVQSRGFQPDSDPFLPPPPLSMHHHWQQQPLITVSSSLICFLQAGPLAGLLFLHPFPFIQAHTHWHRQAMISGSSSLIRFLNMDHYGLASLANNNSNAAMMNSLRRILAFTPNVTLPQMLAPTHQLMAQAARTRILGSRSQSSGIMAVRPNNVRDRLKRHRPRHARARSKSPPINRIPGLSVKRPAVTYDPLDVPDFSTLASIEIFSFGPAEPGDGFDFDREVNEWSTRLLSDDARGRVCGAH